MSWPAGGVLLGELDLEPGIEQRLAQPLESAAEGFPRSQPGPLLPRLLGRRGEFLERELGKEFQPGRLVVVAVVAEEELRVVDDRSLSPRRQAVGFLDQGAEQALRRQAVGRHLVVEDGIELDRRPAQVIGEQLLARRQPGEARRLDLQEPAVADASHQRRGRSALGEQRRGEEREQREQNRRAADRHGVVLFLEAKAKVRAAGLPTGRRSSRRRRRRRRPRTCRARSGRCRGR